MTEPKIYVGIDPGQDGAIVIIHNDGQSVDAYPFTNFKDMFEVLKKLQNHPTFICIEKLWAMPIRGSMANFSLGGNYTAWKALLEILGLSYVEAAPATWQPKILNTSKKKSAETKPLAIEYVNKRYPELGFTGKRAKDIKEYSGRADAICIALYGKTVDLGIN